MNETDENNTINEINKSITNEINKNKNNNNSNKTNDNKKLILKPSIGKKYTLENNKNTKKKIKLLNPKNDYVFKRLFGQPKNEEITKDLISSIMNKEITSINLDKNPILDRDLINDKLGIVDINATLNGNVACDIELQVVNENNIEKRMLYYWSKLYQKGIKKGQDYRELKKTIVIMILDFELETTKEIPKGITKWNIREEDFPKVILTPDFEAYIIEIPKLKRYKDKVKNKELISWMKFIESPGEIDMEKETNKSIKEAKKELEEISSDEREQRLAELRQKYIMDQNAIREAGYDDGYEEGVADGMNTGYNNGIKQGTKQTNLDIAKKLKNKNMDINLISEVTGLTKEEIEKI